MQQAQHRRRIVDLQVAADGEQPFLQSDQHVQSGLIQVEHVGQVEHELNRLQTGTSSGLIEPLLDVRRGAHVEHPGQPHPYRT